MKRKPLIFSAFTLLVLVFLLFQNCGSGEEEIPNKAPAVSISSPSNNSTIELGTTVKITISANDSDGSVVSVKISIDNASVTTLQSSPYSYDWNTSGVSTGSHKIAAVATDNGGLTASSEVTVNVMAGVPIVATADVTEITGTTATSGGNVTDDGGADVTARGVVWGESSGPTLASNSGFTEDGTGTGAFTSSLTGLTAATTYYARAYATNSGGSAYGEEKSFTTGGLPLVETVYNFTDITNTSAVGGGEVLDNGGSSVTARGLVWGPYGGTDVTLDDNIGFTADGTGIGIFSSTMTALTPFTRYSVKAYATNSVGTSYGGHGHFTTLPGPPAVTTTVLSEIIAHTAMSGGVITDFGGADGVYAGIVWSTLPNPDISNNEGYIGFYNQFTPADNDYEAFLTGLDALTTYYIRAWTQNDYGTTYGEEITFETTSFSVNGGSITDSRDGKIYLIIEVYGQTWMAQNLAYLPEVCASDAECGYWVYDYQGTDVSAAKAETNYSDYGVLYNWEMAKTSCPTGWHLPSDEEWSIFEVNIGMDYQSAYGGTGLRGTDEGDKLKEAGTAHWDASNSGTNSVGFNAIPGGEREILDNTFKWLDNTCIFYTSSTWGSPELNIYHRNLGNGSSRIGKSSYSLDPYKGLGFSVRCVQD